MELKPKPKFVIGGVEAVLDVIEADSLDQAQLYFKSKYPAVFKITKAVTLQEFNFIVENKGK